jgi:PAS domain S-box-containing protein
MVRRTETSKRTEKLLQGIQKKVRTLLNVPTDAILLLDRNGKIQDLNETAAARLGRTIPELIGTMIWDFLPSDLVESGKNHLNRVEETGKPSRFEYRRRGHWNDAVIFPTVVTNGEVEYFGVAARDITERKLAEERLLKSQGLLQQIVDGISDPLILLDQEDKIQIINKAAHEYFGLPDTQDFVGKLCFEGLMGKTCPCQGCPYPLSSQHERVEEFERKGLIDPNKVEKIVVNSTFDDLGHRKATIIRISDITHAKKLEKQLIRSEKLASLGLLVSAITHEINNPNTFISLNIPTLRDYLQSILPLADNHFKIHPEFAVCGLPYLEFRTDIFKLIDNMEHGSSRINRIISNLRHYSKEPGQGVACSDLEAAIQKAVEFCQPKLQKKIRSFETDIPDDLPRIIINPEALEQVLVNLIINAVQASNKEDSWIKVQAAMTSGPKPRCILTVSDNGSGIEDRFQDQIFDPFFSTKAASEGTGLGLYVCHNLVQSAGGRIEFDSRWGEGSTFRVILEGLEICPTID